MSDFVYILSNPSFPKLYKVGFTTTSVEERMSQLHSTGVPTRFELEFCIKVRDGYKAEQRLHRVLNEFHYEKEFFKLHLSKLIEICKNELFSGEIDFIEYYGKGNDYYLTDEEVIQINSRLNERKQRDQQLQEEQFERLAREEAEKNERERKLEQLTQTLMSLTPTINGLIDSRSSYLNSNVFGRFMNLNHFEDGKKIGNTLTPEEKTIVKNLYETLNELTRLDHVQQIISAEFIMMKDKIDKVISVESFSYVDRNGVKHHKLRYVGATEFFRGMLSAVGINSSI